MCKINSEINTDNIEKSIIPDDERWFGLSTDSETDHILSKKMPTSLKKKMFSL